MRLNRIKKAISHSRLILCSIFKIAPTDWMPDRVYINVDYYLRMGIKLNLNNPQSFNEKIQWLKLYDRRQEYTMMVDKYNVRSYIADKIGEEYLIPLLGVWDDPDDIDFDALPDQFVLKCTHDSGGLVVCRDKSKLEIEDAKKKIKRSLKQNYYYNCREWPYKNIIPRIIAEKFMSDSIQLSGLIDYKFFCCNGQPKMLYVSQGLENHSTASISFLKLDWTFYPFRRSDYKPFKTLPPKPQNYERMLELATDLAAGFPFLRVDLYEINGEIYFSELTFSPCGGMIPFDPPKWDNQLGEWIKLPIRENGT